MSVNLEKNKIKSDKVFSMQFASINAESDVIVPDVKPDIAKVLQISGDAFIQQQNVQQDKVHIQGVVRLNILYVPDSEMLSGVRSMSTVQDFNHVVSIVGAKPEMKLASEAEVENISYSLINSRKINIRSRVGISIKLSEPVEMDIPIGISCDTPVQFRKSKIKLMPYLEDTEREMVLRQQLEVPSGKGDMAEILKICARPQNMRISSENGQVKIWGDMDISTLYCSMDESSPVMFMQHSVPIDEVVEGDFKENSDDLEGEFKVAEVYSEIRPDGDGDNRVLGVEVVLKVILRCGAVSDIEIIDDAYSLTSDTEVVRKSYKTEQLTDRFSAEETAKVSAEIPDYLPEISQICDTSFCVNVDNVNIENNKITVYGTYVIRMIYLSENSDTPVSGFEHTSDFEHSFETPFVDLDCACDAQAEAQYVGYTITSSRDVEFRLKSNISVKLFKTGEIALIDKINLLEDDLETEKCPSIIIYFVQKGDTLWNIAKRYKTTVDRIVSDNDLNGENISVGQQLKIIRCS